MVRPPRACTGPPERRPPRDLHPEPPLVISRSSRDPGPHRGDVERFLPLRPVEFHVLLSVTAGARHGYGIMQDAAKRTGEEVIPDVGTLYRALRRMVEAGLIEPVEEAGSGRRNDYRVTPLGRRVAEAESVRLASLVRAARSGGLLGEEG